MMSRGPRKITIYNNPATGKKVFFRFEDGQVKLVIFDYYQTNKNIAVDVYRIQNSKVRKLLNWLAWLQRRK